MTWTLTFDLGGVGTGLNDGEGAVEDDEDAGESDDEDNGTSKPLKVTGGKMNIALRDVNIKEGKVIVAGREESGRTALEGMCIFPWSLLFLLT